MKLTACGRLVRGVTKVRMKLTVCGRLVRGATKVHMIRAIAIATTILCWLLFGSVNHIDIRVDIHRGMQHRRGESRIQTRENTV